MLISLPFLADAVTDADDDMVRYAMGGSYPVTSHLEWHNGVHLVGPTANSPVRAVADGKVIYLVQPDKEPSQDVTHAQNYGAADGKTKLWTDKGMLILEHETEIGASGTSPVTLKYYSVYMHLKALDAEVTLGKKLYRKAKLGQPGQIYGQPNHMHFEICMNEANLTTLLGHAPANHPAVGKVPSDHGRTDVVYGNTYVYLPAKTPALDAEPSKHLDTTSTQKLDTALWVQIAYAGSATLTSYYALGDQAGIQIGQRSDPEAEYKLYTTANDRHVKVKEAAPTAKSSPSGWYELLRFGRNLGRGPLDTDKDPLPDNAEHWRKICTPAGEKWANLNAKGTFKFSDADFPSFLGWQCIDDDENTTDQRCDSPALRSLLAVSIDDRAEREKALQKTPAGRSVLAKQIKHAKVKDKLPLLICKFPSEFDQGTLDARYGHVKEEDEFKDNKDNWAKFTAHIQALTRKSNGTEADNCLPSAYINAQWHVHPVAFINQMRKCGWLSKEELVQCIPKNALRTGQWKDAHGVKHPGVFWEEVVGPKEGARGTAGAVSTLIANHRIPLNRTMCKYGISTPLRKASFFGNAIQESGWLSSLQENAGNSLWYEPWFGRGFLQLTSPGNYFAYWRWRGRTLDAVLQSQLQNTYDDMYKNSTKRSQKLLDDAYFPAVTQQIKDWRAQVNGGARSGSDEEKLAPSDSAGFYWASLMIKYADGQHVLERRSVAIVDGNGQPQGNKVYYRSPTFWKVSASVNLPGAIGHSNYSGINGFDSRCSAYGVALAVLTEMKFESGEGPALEYPEGYTPRSAQ